MPWNVSDRVSERMAFVVRLKAGERMTDLCQEFGISRKTGYKLWERFRELGAAGLFDMSRRPHRMPRQTSEAIRQLVIEARQAHRTWGPRKLRIWLGESHPGLVLPSTSTMGEILARAGLVVRRKRRPRVSPYSSPLRRDGYSAMRWCRSSIRR